MESMFYYGEVPWHGLGKNVEHVLTAEEAINEAGLNWDVELAQIYTRFGGKLTQIKERRAVRRMTDGQVLGVMSPSYAPVQNREAFKFFDSVVGTGEAKYHTAGSLRGGQRIWMLAKVDGKGSMSIKGDAVDKYLLLLNGHDGGLALKMFFTPVRVVCMNTLMAAEAGSKRIETFYAKHMGNITTKLDTAREILGMTMKFFDGFQEKATKMAMLALPAPQFPKMLCAAFGDGRIRPEDVVRIPDFVKSEKQQEEMEMVQMLFEGSGKGLNEKGIRGTRWAAYNAVVEHVDYEKQFRGDNAANNRLENIWFWGGQRIKQRAWDYLNKV